MSFTIIVLYQELIMQTCEVEAILKTIENIELKLSEAAGIAVLVELRMRLIGELFDPVKDELAIIIENAYKDKKRKIDKREYWNCNLTFLDDAILKVFSKELLDFEINQLKEFRQRRNKLLHADFIGLMKKLNIGPTGREIMGSSGKKNCLNEREIQEAIKSIDRNQGFEKFRHQANEVILILDKLIRYR